MKVIAPRKLLLAARRAPEAVTRVLAELERRNLPAPGEARAELLDDQQVLGVEASAEAGGLALRFLARISPAETLGPLPPLAGLSRLELQALGVPAEAVPPLHRLQRLEELDQLDLDPDVRARVRFRALQLAPGLLPTPGTGARVAERVAIDRTHLERYLHGEIAELMLHLDPTQQRIVDLDGSGAIVVRGVAGSGKTAVALHRVHRLLRQRSLFDGLLGGPRLLFLTFNRALAAVARQLVQSLGLGRDALEITTLHRYARRLVPDGRLLDAATRRSHLAQARQEVRASTTEAPLWGQADSFFQEELSFIKTRVTGGLDEYLALRRHGAARPLDARARTLMWQVLQAYDRRCAAADQLDFDELVRRAYLRLFAEVETGAADAPAYDHVLVDEAQDFPALGLRLAALLGRTPGHVFLAYDPAQSLYQRGFRWKDGGLVVRGARSIDLARNFRNTREILETARPLLSRGPESAEASPESRAEAGTEAGADTPLDPEPATRAGPPVARLAAVAGEEIPTLVSDLRARLSRGLGAGSVAVLALRNQDLLALEGALTGADIAVLRHARDTEVRLADPRVKLLTVHSAKGLEFPVVYLLATAASLRTAAGAEGDETRVRRLLYVAMTRALHALVLVTTTGAAPPGLGE